MPRSPNAFTMPSITSRYLKHTRTQGGSSKSLHQSNAPQSFVLHAVKDPHAHAHTHIHTNIDACISCTHTHARIASYVYSKQCMYYTYVLLKVDGSGPTGATPGHAMKSRTELKPQATRLSMSLQVARGQVMQSRAARPMQCARATNFKHTPFAWGTAHTLRSS
jgi:hypothetical protein